MEKIKYTLKESDWVKENYRRLRKIFLHIIHGRFWSATKLANHYNPIYRLLVKTRVYNGRRQKKNLTEVLSSTFPSLYIEPDNSKKTIAIIISEGHNFPRSSAFIRLISPLTSDPVKKHYQLRIISEKNFLDIDNCEIVIVQRTALSDVMHSEELLQKIKQNHSKLIVDTDDDFAKIPLNHPEHKKQSKKVAAFNRLIRSSDEVWVSQINLVKSEYKEKTHIISNSLDKRLWANKNLPLSNKDKKIQMIYMGTATHDQDFRLVLPVLEELHGKYPGSFKLSIVGITEDLPGHEWVERLLTPRFGSLYPSFVKWFVKQGPFDVGLSPLVYNEFNKSKSDIKALDYIAAGVMPVVSEIEAYRGERLDNLVKKVGYKDGEWFETLESIVLNPNSFREESSEKILSGQEYIWSHRNSEVTSKIILERLQSISS